MLVDVRGNDFLEDVRSFIDELAEDYADGLIDMVEAGQDSLTDEMKAAGMMKGVDVKEEYLLEAIRIGLGIPTGMALPNFFRYIAQKAVAEIAVKVLQAGYDIRWNWQGDYGFCVYPEKQNDADE
jgi:hypothetical protein